MAKDFETLNKQIAAFIVVSSALAVPAFADSPQISPNMPIDRYAGPGMVIYEPSEPPMVVKYAGPGIGDWPAVSEPNEPMVVKYAGPGIGDWPAIEEPDSMTPVDQLRQLNNPENLRVIDSADSVTIYTSEDDHEYRATKVAPGRFKFW